MQALDKCASLVTSEQRWTTNAGSDMAVITSPRHAADEEAQAEVEVLNSRLEKTSQLTKKIQASLTRLESSGRSVQDAIGPIYGNTQKLQVLGRSEMQVPVNVVEN
jgi:hypothetical protein